MTDRALNGARRAPAGNLVDHADPQAVKAFHRCFVTGVTVVTVIDDDQPRGLAVNAFASVSLDPPLVMVCIARSAKTYEAFFRSETFGVNLLAADQVDVARRFAVSGGDKFAGLDWEPGPYGSPMLRGGMAFLEARLESRIEAGTHVLFVGRVLDAQANASEPLIYWDGQLWHPDRLRNLQEPSSTQQEAR
jgi:flavin reductase (DIM6/NTAB) family NADH-FMN oxidoreductase RutF